MKVREICEKISLLYPPDLAQNWDNTGFLVGENESDVDRILLAIDITRDVVAEAQKCRARMIVSYHPVIWDGLKNVRSSGSSSVVYELIRRRISVYSIHTACDVIAGGVNDQLAGILGIVDAEPIGDFVKTAGQEYKFVVFVPADDVNIVAEAAFAAGAGGVGNYTKCSFRSQGEGTFLPGDGARPAIGKKGKLETVREIKLEFLVSADSLSQVISAVKQAHPYEEVAFDVLRNYAGGGETVGLGRMGILAEPLTMDQLIERVKKTAGAKWAGIAGPRRGRFKKGAVCAGSCGNIINKVIAAGCDIYLTGEIKHHQALAAAEAGLCCVCLSHSVSERFALKNIAKQLQNELKGVTIRQSRKDKDPFEWKSI